MNPRLLAILGAAGAASPSFGADAPRGPSSHDLAMRDQAMASLLGALPADFGSERETATFGGYGNFGYQPASFGDDWGADAPAAAAPMPTQAQAMQLWQQHHQQMAHTNKRVSLLDPNQHSKVKVERYDFPIESSITLAAAAPLANMTSQPDVSIRPDRVAFNAPSPAFVMIGTIKAANVTAVVGGAARTDAFFYNANGVDAALDLPLCGPQTKVTIEGDYTGLVPPGFVGVTTYPFCASLKGWATLAGG